MIFDPSAFDFLENKCQQPEEIDIRRTSLLMKFDPLCQPLSSLSATNTPKAVPVLKKLSEEESLTENESTDNPVLLKLNETLPSAAAPPSPPSVSSGIQITAKSVKVSFYSCLRKGWKK